MEEYRDGQEEEVRSGAGSGHVSTSGSSGALELISSCHKVRVVDVAWRTYQPITGLTQRQRFTPT